MKKSPLLPIFLIVGVDVMGLTLILPLLPFYAEHFGASPQQVGLLVSTFAVCQLLAGPVLGQISDRTGRRLMLLVSQVGTLIGFLMLAYAHSLWMVFLSRIIDGITAGNLSLAQAYIADVTEAKDRAKSFAVIGISFGLGFLIGPAISGFLSQYGYVYPIFAAAALSATSILATYFLLPKHTPMKEHEERKLSVFNWSAYSRFFKNRKLSSLLTQFFLFQFGFATFISGFALFAERRYSWHGAPFGPKQVGYVYAYVGLLGIILQGGLIGKLVKKFGEHKIIKAGFVSSILGYGALGFTTRVSQLLGTSTVSSFGGSVLRPCLTSLITQCVSRGEQGIVLGLNQSLNSVAQIIAPIIAGFLINHGHLEAWALTAAAAAMIALIVSVKEPG